MLFVSQGTLSTCFKEQFCSTKMLGKKTIGLMAHCLL